MKTLTRTALFASALCVALPVAAASKIDSVYTSLDSKDCKTLESHTSEGSWYKGRCAGVAGYQLDVTEGDLRQSLTVVTPNGKEFPLEMGINISDAFSTLGQNAEWRIHKNGNKITPYALIVRFNASENPEHPEKTTSYLVVSKITASNICITDVVRPIPDANTKARELADTATSKSCDMPLE